MHVEFTPLYVHATDLRTPLLVIFNVNIISPKVSLQSLSDKFTPCGPSSSGAGPGRASASTSSTGTVPTGRAHTYGGLPWRWPLKSDDSRH